ncbi:glycosyltransferase family 2 protein [Sphingobium sufflavum]|uniref:glycosyltransferase n=1 Tax=Sphingobium sufflavum TaxID=1129547 RepID=UPI001F16990D|nr:glycosyltransferase family 2 protein [Sphingobium sufflavum]MCE7798522.1 glycosyltransferase family 2 protein [Sphingobium sufflavum]
MSICIVAYNNCDDILDCCRALSAQTYNHADIVICENGGAASFERLKAAVATLPDSPLPITVLLAPGNIGYAGGVNLCIAARPQSDYWWVLNPDTAPRAEALGAMVERLGRGDVEAVGSVLLLADDRVQSLGGRWRPWLARCESIGFGSAWPSAHDFAHVEAQVNFISGASMLATRRFVEQAGLMREDYFLYCEEVEWALRAQKRGLKLGVAPGSIVVHGQGGTTGSGAPVKVRPKLPIYLDERNKMNMVHDTAPWQLLVAGPAALGLLTMRYLARGAWRQWLYALDGWVAGICNRRGQPGWLGRK